MVEHEISLRVRYAETDRMGYVYYGRYMEYLEMARTDLIRSLGVTYRQLEDDHGVGLPVLKVEVTYIRPAKYDDVLRMVTRVPEMPTGRITFETEIYKEDELINKSRVVLCFVDGKTGRPTRPPEIVLEAMKSHF